MKKSKTQLEKCHTIWPKIRLLSYARLLLHICQITKPNVVNFRKKPTCSNTSLYFKYIAQNKVIFLVEKQKK